MSRIPIFGHRADVISATPEITAGAYSAGDAVGGLLTFTSALIRNNNNGGKNSGKIESAVLIDNAKQDADIELWLFDSTFPATGDNDAFAPSDADLLKLIGVIPFTTYYDGSTNSVAPVADVGIRVVVAADATSLFGQLVTRGTPTYASTSDITVRLGLQQD